MMGCGDTSPATRATALQYVNPESDRGVAKYPVPPHPPTALFSDSRRWHRASGDAGRRGTRNSMLKAIGFWIRDLGDESYPAPQELVGALPAERRLSLTHYLESGATFEQYLGYAWCRFMCGGSTQSVSDSMDTRLGSRELTDGTWVWPEGLAHYVREHGIVLPEEFIKHATSWTLPTTPNANESVETEFWERWCAARRSAAVLTCLRSARVLAESEIEELRSQTALAREAEIETLI